MIEIKLRDDQNAYEVVGEYIKRYWEHNLLTDVIVSICTSHDGKTYDSHNEIASPFNFDSIEYLKDWWEGEKYIRIYGIQAIDSLGISGGIYMED